MSEGGWNSIGRFNETGITAESFAVNITNCTSIAYWNSTLGRFILHPKGADISDFLIRRNMGFMVWVSSDETWVNE